MKDKINNKKIEKLTFFTKKQTKEVKFNTSFVKFANLYIIKNVHTKFLIAIFSGLLMSILTVFLVEVTGLYIGGITAFFQGLARFFYSIISVKKIVSDELALTIYNLMFWGFYLTFNIPLFFFAYFKINKRFALLSMTYLVTLQVSGFLWSLIPEIHNIMLFGDTSTVDQNLQNFNIQIITFSPNVFPTYEKGTDDHEFNWNIIQSIARSNNTIINSISAENITKFFLLAVYALSFSIFSSFFYSVMYMISGSTAGGDIISIYYSQEKNKNLGLFLIVFNSITMSMGVIFGSYLSSVVYGNSDVFLTNIQKDGIIGNPYIGWQYIVSANLIASFIWVFSHGLLINRLFPWQKMVRAEIFISSLNIDKITNELKEIKYTHPTTIFETTGGYSNCKTKSLVTIMQCIELPEFVQAIRYIDDKCLISITYVADIDGYMTLQKQAC